MKENSKKLRRKEIAKKVRELKLLPQTPKIRKEIQKLQQMM